MFKKEFLSFCIVGGIAFFVDAGVFHVANMLLDNYYLARIVSYLFAVTFTWHFNKKITFGHVSHPSGAINIILEWLKFLYTQSFGFAINYSVFSVLVTFTSFFKEMPILAIAFATIPSLFINFLSAKFLVFNSRKVTNASKRTDL